MSAVSEQPLAVAFGAGNVGKGLLGELFQDAGLTTVFIEKNADVVEALRRKGSYQIRLHGCRETVTRTIGSFEVYRPDEPMAHQALCHAEVCATAVGAANLQSVAPFIAKACRERGGGEWNVLVCENWHEGAQALRQHVKDHLYGSQAELPGFVQCSVERIVVRSVVESDGQICVDGEHRYPLFADGGSWRGDRPQWRGLEFVSDINAYFDRKLYTSNFGHALLGYLGYLRGYALVCEAAEDAEIAASLRSLLDRVAEALSGEYDVLSRDALRRHVDFLMRERFPNRGLGDTVGRVCRDPLRKLSPDERIVGTLRLLQRHGLPTEGFGEIVAGAVSYALENEPGEWLRAGMDQAEMARAIANVTGLDCSSQVVRESLSYLKERTG